MDPVLSPERCQEIAKEMAIASTDEERGQRDGIGFASNAPEMRACMRASADAPRPTRLSASAETGKRPLLGAICPHDDYLYAGRVYREVLPHVVAPIVIVVGVFHRYWRLGVRERIGFEDYARWRTPDGPLSIAPLREAWRAALSPRDHYVSRACHDVEHSIEAIAYWLRHGRPDRAIVPVLAPGARFERLVELANEAGRALARSLRDAGRELGRDVAVVISADAVHYGEDFSHAPFGSGTREAYELAVARDHALLRALEGPIEEARAQTFFETVVDPEEPDRYRVPWCGRFSIPFGLLLLRAAAAELGFTARAEALCYGTSIDPPALALPETKLGVTAPADLRHFVGHPGMLFTKEGAGALPDARTQVG